MTDPFFEYREIMTEFYHRAAELIKDNPEFITALEKVESYFQFFTIDATEKQKVIFDWFVFEPKSKLKGKRILDYILDEEALAFNPDLTILQGFRENIFSVFEVKAIRMGKELIICDLVHDKEYQVRDEQASRNLQKKECVFLRALPFKDYFILTGMGYSFPKEMTPVIKLTIRNIRESASKKKRKFSVGPVEMCQIFFSQKKREILPPLERFRLFCEEAGLTTSYINEVLDKTKEKAAQKGYYDDILPELYKKLDPRKITDPKEITTSYIEVWNSLVAQAEPFVEKGPMEHTLINICIDYTQNKVDSKTKDAQKKLNKLQKEWFESPLEEFGGRTPTEIILEERERLGNPQKEVSFSVSITELHPGEEYIKKAEETFHQAVALMKQNKPVEALKAYEEHLALHPENFVAWQNKGVCHILLLEEDKAKRAFQKALQINPKYEMAKRNLEILKHTTHADLERIAKEFRVVVLNEDKTLNL